MKQAVLTRQEVYSLIDGERTYQDSRWQSDTTENGIHFHTPEEWIMYMEDYLAEAKHVLSRNAAPKCYPTAMAIIRKVTAMGVCAIEQNGSPARITALQADVEIAAPAGREVMYFKSPEENK